MLVTVTSAIKNKIYNMKLKKWLDKGEGGEWFEPNVTNRDLLSVGTITAIVCGIIIAGCWIVNSFY